MIGTNVCSRGRVARLICGMVCCLLIGSVAAQNMRLEVVELYTRSAEELIPVLEPMLTPGGRISGVGSKLVIRTTPANFADLRRMLATLDAPPQSLLISVRQDVAGRGDGQEFDIAGSVGGDDVRVTVPGGSARDASGARIESGRGRNRLRARANATRTDDSRSALQTVRVIEGHPAFITLGESVPVINRVRSVGPDGATITESTTYRDVGTGFYAVARVNGGQVTVQLAASADTVVDRRTGTARIQRVSSVVSGPLGQWLEIGGMSQSRVSEQSGIGSHHSQSETDSRTTYIKVERMK